MPVLETDSYHRHSRYVYSHSGPCAQRHEAEIQSTTYRLLKRVIQTADAVLNESRKAFFVCYIAICCICQFRLTRVCSLFFVLLIYKTTGLTLVKGDIAHQKRQTTEKGDIMQHYKYC